MMADNICTAHQIVDKDGEPSKATVTSNLWVSDPGCFAGSRDGNDAKYFVSGKAYFADLLAEFAHAKSQILIAGWQISWDALLAPGVRLYDALLSAAKANPALKIYIMPWDDREPVQTYDDQTIAVFLQMNKKLGREQVYAQLSPTYAVTDKDYYAHHQKLVVIDQKIAYVGGMDLAYGRYCDEHYTLRADADGREGMNRYNGGVAQVGTVRQSSIADPDLLSWEDRIKLRGKSNAEITAERINSGGIQPKYESAGMVVSATGASFGPNPAAQDALARCSLPDTRPCSL
jgi:phospholipase D1/2